MRIVLVAVNARYAHTNPAVRLIRGALRRAGFDASIVEAHLARPHAEILRAILEQAPDIVGFSCYIWNVSAMERLIGDARELLPGALLVAGGPEAASDPGRAFTRLAVDAVALGEGEAVMPELARRWHGVQAETRGERQGLLLMPGVAVRTEDGWANGGRLPPEPMEERPSDEREDLTGRIAYAETARGCPYACAYCLSSRDQGMRALATEAAVCRLLRLADSGAHIVKLVDRTFNFSPARAREIWAALLERSEMRFHFEIGAHLIGSEDIEVLSRAAPGRFVFEIGVQSTCGEALAAVGRRIPWREVRRGIALLREETDVELHIDLIAGLPGEGLARFGESFDDAWRALEPGRRDVPRALQLGFLKILPGTRMEGIAAERGYRWSRAAPYEVLSTDALSYGDLCRLHDLEALLGWMGEGRMQSALELLCGEGSPFCTLLAMSGAMREAGAFARPLSAEDRFTHVLRARPGTMDEQALTRALARDWAAQGKPGRRPDWMATTTARGRNGEME